MSFQHATGMCACGNLHPCKYLCNPVLPLAFSSSWWLPSSAPTEKDGEEKAVMTMYQWAVFCLFTPRPSIDITSHFQPVLHHFSSVKTLHLQTLEHDFIVDKLQWQLVLLYFHKYTCTCDLCSWYMYCSMHECSIKMREKTSISSNAWNFFPSQTKRQHYNLHFTYLCKRLPFHVCRGATGP